LQICIIFNPAARGNKARHFRRHLDEIAAQCALKATSAPGDARRLAAQAVADGFDLIVAAGGDGTVHETLNGLGDVPGGFARARLGVLPLGTINVFARELKIPLRIPQAWQVLLGGRERKVDLPWAEFTGEGRRKKVYFAQLAGAGLDARAIELVSWSLKKRFGPLAYVVAGLQTLREGKPCITAQAGERAVTGELVLIGNGRLYGGTFNIFPAARLDSGAFELCGVPRMDWKTLLRCAPGLLLRGRLPENAVQRLAATRFTLSSPSPAAFELDGEWIGHLPAEFGLEPQALRVAVP
jgi:YegS/Rv2252/BmrU family lipid kinase